VAGVVVILEVEYDVESVEEAQQLATRDAVALFRQDDVLAVSADAKVPRSEELPITAGYLQDEPPRQMDVDECISEAEGA
jgi:hypothetical protein